MIGVQFPAWVFYAELCGRTVTTWVGYLGDPLPQDAEKHRAPKKRNPVNVGRISRKSR